MKSLNEIPRRNPFKVPENYFEEVNRSILDTASKVNETRPVPEGLYRKLRPYLAVAASLIVLAVLGYYASKFVKPERNNIDIAKISMEEFSSSYLDEVDVHILENEADSGLITDKMPEVSRPEIIDYLLTENIDLNDIYQLL
ncbi:MAG: hypothetical protein ABSG89_13135 [Bacteroidales bacterium]|jgi:hypothetical protein